MPGDCHSQQKFFLAHATEAANLTPRDILGPVLSDLPAPGRTRHAPPLARCLSRWTACLRTVRLESPDGPVLALWLPVEVEDEVERTLIEEPALGLLLHRLAARLIMATLANLRPDLVERRCAPLPEIGQELTQALSYQGLATENGHLARRYAVLTFDHPGAPSPHREGCAGCSLRSDCPGPSNGETP